MELGLRDRSCTWRGIGSEKQEARVRIIVQYLVKQFYLPAYKIRKKQEFDEYPLTWNLTIST